ncbi:hypothetical protein PGT21_037057 [Puccinia graminis f. sp. tritici]|uniref:Uncharacterized protein n=1 Tax=Puccinia graminis f. sp. tritici TaxID=56615 RepID=A0A5B0R4W1_PUCGR|nr:hypothetical protein PGT21_037057 [Puccinia graminis f. sp. tritici]
MHTLNSDKHGTVDGFLSSWSRIHEISQDTLQTQQYVYKPQADPLCISVYTSHWPQRQVAPLHISKLHAT